MSTDKTYGLEASVERAVAYYCATMPKFYGTLGHSIDPKLIRDPAASLAVKTAQAIAKDLGHGPSSATILLQRLRREVNAGKITEEQVKSVIDLLIDMAVPPNPNELIVEVAPVIQRGKQQDLVRAMIDEFAASGDFSGLESRIRDINSIGKADVSVGLKLGADTFSAFHELRTAERMLFGLDELDYATKGLIRGCQCLFIGGTGSGKSMALTHIAAISCLAGKNTAVASLEISEALWSARAHSAITLVPIDSILDGSGQAEVEQRIQALLPTLGFFVVKSFPAKLTTAIDIERWVEDIEEREGIKIEVLVVDYVDKLSSHRREDRDEYAGQGAAAERLRVFAETKSMWSYTASQALRRAGKEKGRKLDVDDGADSQHKARVADMVITINPSTDGEVVYKVVKWRHGSGVYESPPIPHAWHVGRLCL